ncbi:MAG TPA: twin-arginine translocase TatA/TatE family subunit [Tepidiformaceae bacterium]|nr:twin-arginine translocase TatA/TatE family subunit [Tepidiformaceae bacterium]
MIGDIGIPELLIILAVVMLLFGAGKISSLGKDLGTSVKEFKKAIKDEDADNGAKPGTTSTATPTYQVLDAQPQQQYVAQPPPQQYVPAQPPMQQAAPPAQPVAPAPAQPAPPARGPNVF